MTDLDERLRGIDRLSTPDLWEAAQARAEAGAESSNVSLGRRFAIIAASLAIGLAAVAWVVVAIRPESRPPSIGSVPAGSSQIKISPAADGALSASWTFGDTVRVGVPVDVLGPGPTSVGSGQRNPKPGTLSEFLGVEGYSIDYGALGAVEPSAMSIPADVRIASGEETALLTFRAGEGQGAGYVEWGEMTVLRTPTDLRDLGSGGRYRIVVVGRGTDDALFQFAFDVDVMPQASATTPDDVTLLVSSSGPSGDEALLTGTLMIQNGCLAVGSDDSSVYVVWPAGYALEKGWLLDDSGNQVAKIGDDVQMGGGITNLARAEPSVPGGIPSSCEVGGPDAYWFAGKPEVVFPTARMNGTNDWLRRVVLQAGYSVVVDEDDRLVADGDGQERFFISVERVMNLEGSALPPFDTIDGTDVFGWSRDGIGQVRWNVDDVGLNLSPGPYGGDILPSAEGIERLVVASLRVPYSRQDVEVPDVGSLYWTQAVAALDEAGLRLRLAQVPRIGRERLSGSVRHCVVRQDPLPGTRVGEGTRVELTFRTSCG